MYIGHNYYNKLDGVHIVYEAAIRTKKKLQEEKKREKRGRLDVCVTVLVVNIRIMAIALYKK